MSLERSATDKLFHATGPLTAKLLSPLADRRRERPVINLQYSDIFWSQSMEALEDQNGCL